MLTTQHLGILRYRPYSQLRDRQCGYRFARTSSALDYPYRGAWQKRSINLRTVSLFGYSGGQQGMACPSSKGPTTRISHGIDSRRVAAVLPTTIRCHLPCDEVPITSRSVQYWVTVWDKQSSGVPIST